MALRHNLSSALVGVCLVQLASPPFAAAYIDPAAGSLLLQVLLGGVAGILVIGKLYYRKLMTLLGRQPRNEVSRPAEGPPEPK